MPQMNDLSWGVNCFYISMFVMLLIFKSLNSPFYYYKEAKTFKLTFCYII